MDGYKTPPIFKKATKQRDYEGVSKELDLKFDSPATIFEIKEKVVCRYVG